VGLLGCDDTHRRIFEHGPVKYDVHRSMCDKTLLIELPYVHNSIEDIVAFESMLPTTYLLGYRDCRHHVLDLLEYLYYK
jgi:hypothetical protein